MNTHHTHSDKHNTQHTQGSSKAGGDGPLEALPFTITHPHGVLSGYKQTTVTVRFAPSAGVMSHQVRQGSFTL